MDRESSRRGDSLEDRVRRSLALGEGHLIRDTATPLSRAKLAQLVGVIHDCIGDMRVVTVSATVAEALTDLVSSEDDVVRFAAIDALAIAGHQECDFSLHVPALVRGLEHKGKVSFAPGSGTWWTTGLAESSQRALGHAVRWPASHDTAVSALRSALERRNKTVRRLAAGALTWGLARRGMWEDVEAVLRSPDQAVLAGALWGLSDKRPVVEIPSSVQERLSGLRADPDPDVAGAAIKVEAKGPESTVTAPSTNLVGIAKGLVSSRRVERREAADLLYRYREDAPLMRSIMEYLICGLGFDTREQVLGLFLPGVSRGFTSAELERLAPLFAGLLLDGDFRSSLARNFAYVCLQNVKARGVSLNEWEPIAAAAAGRAL